MPNIRQLADGTFGVRNENDGVDDLVVGGPSSPSVATPRFAAVRKMKIPLAASDATVGVFSWQNLLGYDIIVSGVIVDITAHATSSCAVSVGQSATAASSPNLIDTLDVGTAAGTFDNITDKGAAGKSRQKVKANQFVTAQKVSGSSGGLAGNAYIEFCPA